MMSLYAHCDAKDRNAAHVAAATSGHEECVDVIIKAGADVIKYEGEKALREAVQYGHYQCVELLLKAGARANSGALDTAAGYGFVNCVNLLIQAGADVNAESLYRAARGGHDRCVTLLTQTGADVNKSHENNMTALAIAAKGGHSICVDLLTKTGADVNAVNDKGETPLILAARKEHLSCSRTLIQSGADVNIVDKKKQTALMFAATNGNENLVRLLIRHKADVHALNHEGDSALVLALEKEKLECADLLIEAGSRMDTVVFKCYQKLLHQAYYNQGLLKLLLKADVLINKVDQDGKQILRYYEEGNRSVWSLRQNTYNLLCVAGEKFTQLPIWMENGRQTICLKSKCREAIRHHLIITNPHRNLFARVGQLGLPSLLSQYLVYNISL